MEKTISQLKIKVLHIAYDLNAWPRSPSNYFKFNNCLFRATSVVKISGKVCA